VTGKVGGTHIGRPGYCCCSNILRCTGLTPGHRRKTTGESSVVRTSAGTVRVGVTVLFRLLNPVW